MTTTAVIHKGDTTRQPSKHRSISEGISQSLTQITDHQKFAFCYRASWRKLFGVKGITWRLK
ncbi:hypothetical protein ACTXT7_001436 [Hymenolepis weldensis]